MENANQKTISTKLSTDYSFVVENQKLLGIIVENSKESVFYSFDSASKEPKVTNEILESALKALLKTNQLGFDIILLCFYELKQRHEYYDIAVKVFKEYWNELYNMVIADTVFERDTSFDSIANNFDFWEENK